MCGKSAWCSRRRTRTNLRMLASWIGCSILTSTRCEYLLLFSQICAFVRMEPVETSKPSRYEMAFTRASQINTRKAERPTANIHVLFVPCVEKAFTENTRVKSKYNLEYGRLPPSLVRVRIAHMNKYHIRYGCASDNRERKER